MAKKAAAAARQAGATVGNAAPGATEQGQNARRRNAAAGGTSTPATSDRGLSVEQEDMERQREEFGAAERGTGDKPPAVHGRTKPVLDSTSATNRIFADTTKPADDKRSVARAQDDVPRTRTVRAFKLGYYDDKRRRLGDVFLIRPPYTAKNTISKEVVDKDDPTIRRTPETVTIDEFSDNWMEDVPANTPLRTTTGKQDLKQKHDEALAARRTTKADEEAGTGNQDVINAGTEP